MVEGVLLRNSSIISQDQSFIYFLYIFVINYKLLDWATGWAIGLAHRVPMGIKTNPRPDPLGYPWASITTGRAVH